MAARARRVAKTPATDIIIVGARLGQTGLKQTQSGKHSSLRLSISGNWFTSDEARDMAVNFAKLAEMLWRQVFNSPPPASLILR